MVHEVDVLNAGPQEPRIVAGNLEEVIMGVVEKMTVVFQPDTPESSKKHYPDISQIFYKIGYIPSWI